MLKGFVIDSAFAGVELFRKHLTQELNNYRGIKKNGRQEGVTELRLEVYCLNESAIKAYEKIGFKRHMIEMRMNDGRN